MSESITIPDDVNEPDPRPVRAFFPEGKGRLDVLEHFGAAGIATLDGRAGAKPRYRRGRVTSGYAYAAAMTAGATAVLLGLAAALLAGAR